jgi:hypothetical protein
MEDQETCQQDGANCTQNGGEKDLSVVAVEETPSAEETRTKFISNSTGSSQLDHKDITTTAKIDMASVFLPTLHPISITQLGSTVSTTESPSPMQLHTNALPLSTSQTSYIEQILITNYPITVTQTPSTSQALSTEHLFSTSQTLYIEQTSSSANPLTISTIPLKSATQSMSNKEHMSKAAESQEEVDDPCLSMPCHDNVSCVSINSTDYTCGPCPHGYKVHL